MALYEFSFASMELAVRSLQLMIAKIERVGYFSIKDGIRPIFETGILLNYLALITANFLDGQILEMLLYNTNLQKYRTPYILAIK